MVLDATFPHQSFKSKKFLTTFKVADSTNRMDSLGVVDFITIVFFADKFDDLPICQRVGDIIRVHRATVSTYKDRKQITANVCFNSSWALFPLHFKGQCSLSVATKQRKSTVFTEKLKQTNINERTDTVRSDMPEHFTQAQDTSSIQDKPLRSSSSKPIGKCDGGTMTQNTKTKAPIQNEFGPKKFFGKSV